MKKLEQSSITFTDNCNRCNWYSFMLPMCAFHIESFFFYFIDTLTTDGVFKSKYFSHFFNTKLVEFDFYFVSTKRLDWIRTNGFGGNQTECPPWEILEKRIVYPCLNVIGLFNYYLSTSVLAPKPFICLSYFKNKLNSNVYWCRQKYKKKKKRKKNCLKTHFFHFVWSFRRHILFIFSSFRVNKQMKLLFW